jgi:glycosyltransferase involved in cell wall biosynthesis
MTASSVRVARLLVVQKHFSVGHGGAPESVLQLARCLGGLGVATDSISTEGFFGGLDCLTSLPVSSDAGFEDPRRVMVDQYDGVLLVGSWNPRAVRLVLAARRSRIPVTYAGKGSLARAEIRRARDLKKIPFLLVVELPLLLLARRVLFSSTIERDQTLVPAGIWSGKGVVLPDVFIGVTGTARPLSRGEEGPARSGDEGGPVIGFLAEISAGKGLAELVAGFLRWCEQDPKTGAVLKIAGAPRPGSERYLRRVRATVDAHRCGNRVEWHGRKLLEERFRFYQSLDILAVPSRLESFGLTPLEALWFGTPVVCAPKLGVLEHIEPMACIRVLPDLRTDTIAQGLADAVAALPDARLDARRRGGQILKRFGDRALAERLAAVLFGSD